MIEQHKRAEYLRTTRPGAWLVLIAVLALLAIFILWSFVGNMLKLQRVSVVTCADEVIGCVVQGRPRDLRAGMEVVFAQGGKGHIEAIDHYIYTPAELEERLGPVARQLEPVPFYVLFSIDTAAVLAEEEPQEGWVVLEEIHPIQLWFSGSE